MEMEVSKRRLLSKQKPERVQEKTMKTVHEVLKDRRLFLYQICAEGETEPARKSGLMRETESIQNKPLNAVNRVQEKRKVTEVIQSAPAQEKLERKPGFIMKPDCVEKSETFIDGAGEKGRLMEISLKNREAERERVLCNWRKIKIEKQREAARLALEQVKNTCGFQDNMDAMRDFGKLVGCSLTSYFFSCDPNG